MAQRDPARAGVRRYLLGRELLVAEVRWHPVWLIRPVLYVVAAVIAGTYLAVRVDKDSPLLDLAGFAFLASILFLAWKVFEWSGERLVVTDRRLIMITGLLTRKVGVMPLRKVTDMTFERPLLGRLFGDHGWGTFVLESAGQDQAMHRIPFLPEPERLYVQVSRQIFGDEGSYGGSSGDDEEDGVGGVGGAVARRGSDRDSVRPTRAEPARKDAQPDHGGRPRGASRDDTTEIPAVRDGRATPGGDRSPHGGLPGP